MITVMNILEQHLLAPYSTYQIGGAADYFVEAGSVEGLKEALAWARQKNLPCFVFGGGSNLLFDDAGFRGLVIRMRADKIKIDGEILTAEAGAMMSQVVKAAAEASLGGLEAWSGLPGTVGGAVYGNAGCFGLETKDVLKTAEIWTQSAGIQTVSAKDLGFSYRNSRLKHEDGVVLQASFKLKKADPDRIRERMRDIARQRIQKQPPGSSTGSFFKNPSPEQPAGKLIDECGLKCLRVGGAQVSEHHANFILNTGGASSSDILSLADQIEKAVFDRFGVQLEREVIFVPASA